MEHLRLQSRAFKTKDINRLKKKKKIPVDRLDFKKKRGGLSIFFFSRWPLSISNQTGHKFFSWNLLQIYFVPICCMRSCVITINRVGLH